VNVRWEGHTQRLTAEGLCASKDRLGPGTRRRPARAALLATRRIGFEVCPTDAARVDRPEEFYWMDSVALLAGCLVRFTDSVYQAAGHA